MTADKILSIIPAATQPHTCGPDLSFVNFFLPVTTTMQRNMRIHAAYGGDTTSPRQHRRHGIDPFATLKLHFISMTTAHKAFWFAQSFAEN